MNNFPMLLNILSIIFVMASIFLAIASYRNIRSVMKTGDSKNDEKNNENVSNNG